MLCYSCWRDATWEAGIAGRPESITLCETHFEVFREWCFERGYGMWSLCHCELRPTESKVVWQREGF
jgi:hypothetical protein